MYHNSNKTPTTIVEANNIILGRKFLLDEQLLGEGLVSQVFKGTRLRDGKEFALKIHSDNIDDF